MIKINLLASESIKKEERNEILIIGYIIFVIIILIGMLRYGIKFTNFKKLETRLSQSKTELNKYENIVKQVEALQATKTVLETKKNVINSLMVSRLLYPYFMEKILELMPSGIWFKTMNTKLLADGKIEIILDAETLDNFAIADLISALLSNPEMSGVELGNISSAASSKISSSLFRLTFSYQKKKI